MTLLGRGTWKPSLGACCKDEGVAFRVWAPTSSRVEVILDRPEPPSVCALDPHADGTFSALIRDVRAGDRYRYRLDQNRQFPDPASRFQPEGVHGPSEVVDPRTFPWTDTRWTGLDLAETVFYELHVGTFTPEGTFGGATVRLEYLAWLGVTAVELMPVADFPGDRNWGYDGAALFAPARCYGTPSDLRRFVDTAHSLGIGVYLDVVYSHLGPDGAYPCAFSPYYLTDRHQTPWGAGVDFDGDRSPMVREFFIENALHWIHEYHVDGLRLDATHAIGDNSSRHFLAELTARVRESVTDRRVLVLAEDHRNLNWMLKPERDGGWGVDAVWADDFHHQCHHLLTGESEGYYRDYSGRTQDLATTIRRGWFYTGQYSVHFGEPRGTDPAGVSAHRFIICLQNHDQVGNRALGDRLHHQIDPAAYRAASVLLLMAPESTLLFMGQEWAARSPFLYFTDHHEELGRLVTEGRREEFHHFAAFSDSRAHQNIPDPQAPSTFARSRLDWNERLLEPHAAVVRLYRALLALRRHEPTLGAVGDFQVKAPDSATITVLRNGRSDSFLCIARLAGSGVVALSRASLSAHKEESDEWDGNWTPVLNSEAPDFTENPAPPLFETTPGGLTVRFLRPAAIVLKRTEVRRTPDRSDASVSIKRSSSTRRHLGRVFTPSIP